MIRNRWISPFRSVIDSATLNLERSRARESLRRVLHELGDEAARRFGQLLAETTSRYRHVIVITHVPPFREATWHQQRTSDDNWLPRFSCEAVGDVLLQAAESSPGCQLLVLCGHTRGGGDAQLLDNLRVLAGEAEYGRPEIQLIIAVV